MRKHRSDTGIVALPKIAPHLRLDVVAVDAVDSIASSAPGKSLLVTAEYDKNYCRAYPIGELAEKLLAAIDGRADAVELLRRVTAQSRRPHHEIAALLQVFSNAGIVICGRYEMRDGQAAVWLNQGFTPAFVEHVLARASVAVADHSAAPACARALRAALRGLGVRLRRGPAVKSKNDLAVVVVDDYLQDELADLNRDFLRDKTRWLPVKLTGGAHWAGPVFNDAGDGESGDDETNTPPHMATDFCWHCLAARIRSCRQIEQAKLRQTGLAAPPAPAAGDAAIRAGAHLAGMEIARYLLAAADEHGAESETKTASSPSPLIHSLWVFDQVANQAGRHRVNKNPRCEACETPSPHGLSEVKLDGDEAGIRYAAGGWRALPPEQTYANFRHLNNAYTGVLELLKSVPNPGDDFCFVYESDNNIATMSDSVFISMASIRMRNAGKGGTPAMARAGALCEAIERYSACLHGDEIRRRARYCDFPEGQALMPNRFMNLSARQFAGRHDSNRDAAGNPFVNIPAKLGEDEACEWSPLWSVTGGRICWAPTQSLYYGYPYAGRWIAIPDTNGVAAGNTRAEAFVHAFLEVLERDAVSLWWYNRLACAALDLASVDADSPDASLVSRVVAQYRRRGRECWALDISFDLGVSIFAFMSRRADGGGEICLGFGAHFDPEIALSRAICEHGQLWGLIESRREHGDGGGGNGANGKTVFRDLSPAFSAWLQDTTVADPAFAYLLPAGAKQWRDYPHANRRMDLPAQRRACLRLAQDKDWELYLADFTRPSIGLAVLRVMIPQLRSMHRRLGPGRLYDAPVRLGLLPRAKTEAEMNAIDIFI